MRKLLYLPASNYITYAMGKGEYSFDYDIMCMRSNEDVINTIIKEEFHNSFFDRNNIALPCSREEFVIIEVEDA